MYITNYNMKKYSVLFKWDNMDKSEIIEETAQGQLLLLDLQRNKLYIFFYYILKTSWPLPKITAFCFWTELPHHKII